MQLETAADLEHLLAMEHVVAIRRYGPTVPGVVRAAVARKELTAILPGIYARADVAREPLVRMAALRAKWPNTVFTLRSAAGLLWDPRLLSQTVTATGRCRSTVRAFVLEDRAIDPEWIVTVHGMRCTNRALTAVDLIPVAGADFVDRVLRDARGQGQAALRGMWQALEDHPSRPGNTLRRSVLRESRDIPWSEAERRAHQMLREAGIMGWRTNYPVVLHGQLYFIDIAFPELRLALEIDGFGYHSDRSVFERDRVRHNDFEDSEWDCYHFTWHTLPTLLTRTRQWVEERSVVRPASGLRH